MGRKLVLINSIRISRKPAGYPRAFFKVSDHLMTIGNEIIKDTIILITGATFGIREVTVIELAKKGFPHNFFESNKIEKVQPFSLFFIHLCTAICDTFRKIFYSLLNKYDVKNTEATFNNCKD